MYLAAGPRCFQAPVLRAEMSACRRTLAHTRMHPCLSLYPAGMRSQQTSLFYLRTVPGLLLM